MTLIIGIKCKDGSIVMGADGAATFGALGNSTAMQPTKKLSILQDRIIVGVAGPVGLGQRLKGEMDKLYQASVLSGIPPFEAMTIISQKFRVHILPELETARIAGQVIGNSLASQSALSATLVALPIRHVPSLFQFDQQGSPEETNNELPFVSIGSGQPLADPFLGLIRRVFWEGDGPPTINEAIFAVFWTLRHAISVSPGGVAEPIQIMSLIKDGKDWVAKEYSAEEMEEHEEAIRAIEKNLHDFRTGVVSTEKAKDIPKPQKAS
jgi:20S proteasome alpha/beta subunit